MNRGPPCALCPRTLFRLSQLGEARPLNLVLSSLSAHAMQCDMGGGGGPQAIGGQAADADRGRGKTALLLLSSSSAAAAAARSFIVIGSSSSSSSLGCLLPRKQTKDSPGSTTLPTRLLLHLASDSGSSTTHEEQPSRVIAVWKLLPADTNGGATMTDERQTTTTRGIQAALHLLLPSEVEVEPARFRFIYVVAAARTTRSSNFSCQQGPLNRETKIWGSSNEDGWLLLRYSETWNYTQSLELISSLEPRAEATFFNQVAVLPQAILILLANVKRNAIYAAHVEYGPDPASDRLDCITDFTIAMAILSLTGTHENQSDGEQAVQAYCVPRMVTQRYDLELSLCFPPTGDTTGFGRHLVISCVQEALLDVVGTESSGGTSFTDSYSLRASSKSPRVDQSAEFDMKPSVPPLAYLEGDGSIIHLPSAPLASKIELPGSRPVHRTRDVDQSALDYTTIKRVSLTRQDTPMPSDAARHAPAQLSAVVFLQRRTAVHHAIAEHATVKESSEETAGTEIAQILPPTAAVRFKPGRIVESARLQLTQEPLRVAAQTSSARESNVKRQQSDECRLSNYVDGKQDADSVDNDRLLIPIFVRHASGQLTLRVHLDQPSQNLMQLYAHKTKTRLGNQYFVYGNRRLQPNRTLLSYRVQQDTTVHVCTRLLGGAPPTLAQYVNEYRNMFTVEVVLPDRRCSLQMTIRGCQLLSSWITGLTYIFARGLSWNGQFSLENFVIENGHVRNKLKPQKSVHGSMGNDVDRFVELVNDILGSDKQGLVSKYPPYVESFTRSLTRLKTSFNEGKVLSNEDKLFLETHVCFMTSYARERLIFELYRKYEGASTSESSKWENALNRASCNSNWCSGLSKVPMLKDVMEGANKINCPYVKGRVSAFRFIKDVVMHGEDHITGSSNPQSFGDGKELMIPEHFEDFLPSIIENLIGEKVDISAELVSAIRCACSICDSSSR